MNEHILLVMKWLDDPESVSEMELWDNKERVYFAIYFVHLAAMCAYYGERDGALYCVEEYFKQAGEDKQTYLDKIKEQ